MFRIILKSLQTGVLTEENPFGGHASFGFPVIDFSRCTACDDCARACPTGAIQTAAPAPGRKTVSLSYAACIQCRACVTACPEQAVSVSTDIEIAAYTREQLARTATFDIDPATGRGTFGQVEMGNGAQPGRIGGPAAGADPRPARAFASRASGGRGELQRLRAGDRGHDESRCTTSSVSGSTWSRAPGTPTCCSSPVP